MTKAELEARAGAIVDSTGQMGKRLYDLCCEATGGELDEKISTLSALGSVAGCVAAQFPQGNGNRKCLLEFFVGLFTVEFARFSAIVDSDKVDSGTLN